MVIIRVTLLAPVAGARLRAALLAPQSRRSGFGQ
ncbi:hypothetical protein Y590_03325 [Methylobacterium sp. AMS5]|nr:hypothetical protein Y590_03325 [Methylobacterium sp. AMS5]